MSEVVYFHITLAARASGFHPQTLRIYEARGLIKPARSSKGTRRYSEADIEKLLKIRKLTSEGINLKGIERILKLEEEIKKLRNAHTLP